jgi:hypothetical protein
MPIVLLLPLHIGREFTSTLLHSQGKYSNAKGDPSEKTIHYTELTLNIDNPFQSL